MVSKSARFAVWLAVTAALAGCDSPEERVERHLSRGFALLEQGEDVKAQLEFRNALKVDRDNAPARFELGLIAEKNGDLRGAIGHFRRVVESDPDHVQAQVKIAQFMLIAGELDDAMVASEAATRVAPDDPEVLATRAALLYQTGDVADALDAAQRAVSIDPSVISAHMVLLGHQLRQEGAAATLPATDALLAEMPENAGLNLFKLRLVGEIGDVAAVEAHLRAMIERFPEETVFRRALADSYLARGDIDGAEAEFRAIAAASPENESAALDVARMLFGARGPEAANAELEARAAAAATGDAAMPFRLAQSELALRAGDRAQAQRVLEDAAAAAETTAVADRARVRMAQLVLNSGDSEGAGALAAEVLAGDSDNVEALEIRAALAIDALDIDAAIVDLRRAQNLAPERPQLMLLEARALQLDGNSALAGERLGNAVRVSDFDPTYVMPYARFLIERDQLVAAETALTEASRRHPENIDVLGALAEARLRLGDGAGAQMVAARMRELEGAEATASRISAAALAASGQLQEGIAELERVVQSDEGEQALTGLIAAYVRDGQQERAEAFLDDLVARNPANLRALALRADLHLRNSEPEAARRNLDAMIAAAPDSPAGYILLTRFLSQRGEIDEAEIVAREGVARTGSEELLLSLAFIAEQKGDVDEAIASYELLFDASPSSLIVANNLASLLAEYRYEDPAQIDRATQVARRLRDSNLPHFRDTYGWIAFLRGDTQEALRFLVPAAQALPGNALVRYHVGRAYAETGETALARENLEAALNIDPAFPKAGSARAVLDTLPVGG